ncbi:tonsoku-like protein isoform X2 [Alosa sapidissima]|uniref:tonsoku-like protein isoform X2 n=1 Tax=Alosa sapidissima TaxID=34773 RepID=UPI001C08970D|nr:tonsoku-like protein isoform X2 [Alosa sapidissima]
MTFSREIKHLQKAKNKAQSNHNLREEASLCNQLGELLARNGDYKTAIEEHRRELALSEALGDVIGSAVANRKIGECFAEMGNTDLALKHQRRHLKLACSVNDAVEEQRALATIGRTYLFRYESDQSQDSLGQAEEAFRKSLTIVDDRLEGVLPARELSEMKARLFHNLGCVYDHLKDPQRCSEYIRRSVFIAEKNNFLEDLQRANSLMGRIHFRNSQHSRAMRCLEQAKECARKMKDKFGESECFCSIAEIQLSLGDFVAARRSLKKAFTLGSQHAADREAVKKALKQAIRGVHLEEAVAELKDGQTHEAMGLAEQLGDLYSKLGCFNKALDSYLTQLSCGKTLGKSPRELAVIHVSLAVTYTDLRQHHKAIEHYRQELALRQGNPKEECKTWLNIAGCQEEAEAAVDELDISYASALRCAEKEGMSLRSLQKRVLRQWLAVQQRFGSQHSSDTRRRLDDLCAATGLNPDASDGEEEEEEGEENSEPLEDSDIQFSDSDDEEYDKMLSGRRKLGRWNRRNEKGETCLHRACIDGNLRQVQLLLEQGHPVNPRDYCGWTPLHEAANHGHEEIVAVMLERGANINDPGGPMCDGVTPLHDALSCGHFAVARLLVERGASVNMRNAKGDTALDSLRQWFKTYSRELDSDARQECAVTEKLLRRAMAGGVPTAAVTPKPQALLLNSQLFDAENSEPLMSSQRSPPRPVSSQESPAAPRSTQRRPPASTGRRHRGTEDAILFGLESSCSDQSDSDDPISPLRPIRPRLRFPAAPSAPDTPPQQEAVSAHMSREPTAAAMSTSASTAPSRTEEYRLAMKSLGSATTRLFSQSLSEPAFSSTPASDRTALVPEEEYLADDWLEDDLGEMQPKKKRKMASELEGRRENGEPLSRTSASASVSHTASYSAFASASSETSSSRVRTSSNRGLSMKKGQAKARQVKMTQLSGMVMLGRREVSRSPSPTITQDDDPMQFTAMHQHSVPAPAVAAPMPAPIRMRVRVQDNVFLIPVPHRGSPLYSTADSCTVSWLCEQAAQRYYQTCGLLPRLSLQKEGALLAPQDPLLAVLHTNEEVVAKVCSWDLPPLPERYQKACRSLAVDESVRVLRLCEAQDGSSSVSVCGLSLASTALAPLLRALKLQASLTELRLAANRLGDGLLPELVAAVATMPRLRLLDVSANLITGEGLKKAANSLDGKSQPTFPCLEELNLSMNPLGDGHTQALACLLSACPLLATLSLQGCSLTARFLQQHRLLLASALTGTGHLRTMTLSHNSLGSTGFELVLKTLPLHLLSHLHLTAVCRGPADQPALELLATHLAQNDCSLTHLSLASNGLSDHSVASLARCLPVCPSLVSLDLSANPDVTSAGLHSLLMALREARRPLVQLNLQGCQVAGPWNTICLDDLAKNVRDLSLCSQRLNKLDQQALQQSWHLQGSGRTLLRQSKCMMSTTGPI